MSNIDPENSALRQVVTDHMHTRRDDILREAARDLTLESFRRSLRGNAPGTWREAVEHLERLAHGPGEEPNLVAHARRELARQGENEPAFVESILAAVRGFCSYGHSGGSGPMAVEYLHDILRWRALTPLTSDPGEWEDRTEMSGMPWWQSTRDARAMSHDGGKTYWLVDDPARTQHTAAEPAQAQQ